MDLKVTPLTDPVASETVLMRIPLAESVTVEEEIVTVSTVLSVRPPTEPMERPWPPEHVPLVKVMLVPELMARQSSWFLTTAPEIVISSDDPTSKASVLCPRSSVSPALLSIVTSEIARPVALLMEKHWTGVSRIFSPLIVDVPLSEWA